MMKYMLKIIFIGAIALALFIKLTLEFMDVLETLHIHDDMFDDDDTDDATIE